MATILGIAPIVGASAEFTRKQQMLVMQLLGVTPEEAEGKEVYLQLFVLEQSEALSPRFGFLPRQRKTKHLAWRFALGKNGVYARPRLIMVAKFPVFDFANAGMLCLRWYRRNAPKHLAHEYLR